MDEPETDIDRSRSSPLLVWSATEQSVRDGIPSGRACIETLVGVTGYWLFAIYFQTFVHLWISICIAPLLLMRSDQSIELGINWYSAFWSRHAVMGEEAPLVLVRKPDFWIGVILGLLAIIGIVVLLAGFKSEVGTVVHNIHAFAISLALTYLWFAIIGVTAPGSILIGRHTPFRFRLPMDVLSALLRAMVIRIAATACYLGPGVKALPRNFYENTLLIDLSWPAELVPGFKNERILSRSDELEGFVQRIKVGPAFRFVIFILLFCPIYLYRISIKSTCWIYLPLIYIVARRDTPITAAKLLDYLGWTPRESARRLLAAFTLIAFAATTFASDLAIGGLDFFGRKFVSPLEFFFLIDINKLKPWQIFNLLGALLTVYLLFLSGDARIDLKHTRELNDHLLNLKIKRIRMSMRLRNLFSVTLIGILFVHALLAFSPIMNWLPNPLIQYLGLIYGDYMPRGTS